MQPRPTEFLAGAKPAVVIPLVVVGLVCGGLLFRACADTPDFGGLHPAARPAPIWTLASLSPGEVEVTCQNAVRSQLIAPATAEFPAQNLPVFEHDHWRWQGAVDSQNAFGALLRRTFECRVDGGAADQVQATAVIAE
jgi:hypothetical protein